jgi:hypothetical protein
LNRSQKNMATEQRIINGQIVTVCDHLFASDGNPVQTTPMYQYNEWWQPYVCQRCLRRRYAKVKTYNVRTGTVEYLDGTEVQDRLDNY